MIHVSSDHDRFCWSESYGSDYKRDHDHYLSESFNKAPSLSFYQLQAIMN